MDNNKRIYKSDKEAIAEIIEVGRRMYAKGFVAANDGNISCKVSDNSIWTTCTGVSKGFLTEDMLVKMNLDGTIIKGNSVPSSEVKMHIRVYKENSNVLAVTHAHPPLATSFAIAGIGLNKAILPEAIVQLGTVPVAKYATPGTEGIPDSIAPFCKDYTSVLLANHGALTWGKNVTEAFYHMESVEYYALVTLITEKILNKQNELSGEQIRELAKIRESMGMSSNILPKGISSAVNMQNVY
ncbi:MAG TPA: class II aldolase/adducin family protein [Candidatus Dorea intestinavium]|nr:class II aldolase/adducin family protein [Candidatus Dorea intestinavium]